MSRAKNLSPLPCRLDMLTLGLAHCLRAHSFILRLTRQQWEKTSLRGAYARGNLENMIPHHRFCLRHCLFSPSNMFAASALWGWRRARGRRRGRRATRQRGNVLRKFQKQFQRRGFFGAIAGPKRLLFARACGLLLKKSSSAYALLTRSLRGMWP